MNRNTSSAAVLIGFAVAAIGCQSGPRFAWWKHEPAPSDSSAVARSAAPGGSPALPSAQTRPEAVAVAGLTPATPPSSSNLAAAGAPAGAAGILASKTPSATAAASSPGSLPPGIPQIPVTESTLNNAPTATYPAGNDLADKLVNTPNTKSASAPNPASVPAGGPYDPNGYKAATTVAAGNVAAPAASDRYGVASSAPAADKDASGPTNAMAALPRSPAPLASDPADRYGTSPSGASAAATPAVAAITEPTALAADRYANPALPTMNSQPAANVASPVTTSTPSTTATPAVRLVSAPGQYRPGGTSSYSGMPSNPVEIASRPSAPSATPNSTVPVGSPTTPSAIGGAAGQPWAPTGSATTPPASSRTY